MATALQTTMADLTATLVGVAANVSTPSSARYRELGAKFLRHTATEAETAEYHLLNNQRAAEHNKARRSKHTSQKRSLIMDAYEALGEDATETEIDKWMRDNDPEYATIDF